MWLHCRQWGLAKHSYVECMHCSRPSIHTWNIVDILFFLSTQLVTVIAKCYHNKVKDIVIDSTEYWLVLTRLPAVLGILNMEGAKCFIGRRVLHAFCRIRSV